MGHRNNRNNVNNKYSFYNVKEQFVELKHQFYNKKVYITAIVAFLFLAGLSFLNKRVFKIEDNVNEQKIKDYLKQFPILTTIFVSVMAPIIEELVFRKLIFGTIKLRSKILAYIISCTLFVFAHCFSLGENRLTKTELKNIPYYFLASAILAYAYDYDDCLLASILAHSFSNILDTILFFLF